MKVKNRKTTYAACSLAFTVVVVIIVVVINLLFGAAEKRFSLKLDMTGGGVYALSEQTKNFLGEMKDDFTITVLGEEVKYEQGVRTGIINEILLRYQSASGGHIHLQYVDTYTNPGFLAKYQNETVAENDLILEGSRGHQIIPFAQLFKTQRKEQSLSSQVTGCNAEQTITSALMRLSADTLPEVYLVEGHGETYYEGMIDRIQAGSCKLGRISLLNEDIPEKAALLILSGPQSDFSGEELLKLDDYLDKAGNLILLYGSDSPELPNLDRYLTEWGVQFEKNIIVDPSRYVGNAVQISPLLTEADLNDSCRSMSDRFLLTPGARSIKTLWEASGKRETIPVLVTGDRSYAKSYDNKAGLISTVDKEAGDESGPMNTGVLVKNFDVAEGQIKSGAVLMLSSPSMFSDGLLDKSNLLNDFYFKSVMSYMTGGTGEFVSIPSRSMQDNALNTVGVGNAALFCFVVILPLAAVLFLGIRRWLHRRKL